MTLLQKFCLRINQDNRIQTFFAKRIKIHPNPYTVWKFHDFSITQILCVIDFSDSRSAKSVFFNILKALDFDFLGIFALV